VIGWLQKGKSEIKEGLARVTQWVPHMHMEQELFTLPKHLNSPWLLVGFVLLDLLISM
jgi:hypothetical protein